jgi:hypothetical protein
MLGASAARSRFAAVKDPGRFEPFGSTSGLVGQVEVTSGFATRRCELRKTLIALALALLLVILLAVPALAGGTVNCMGGGNLTTIGKSTVSQQHSVSGIGTTPDLGPGYIHVNWGWHTSSYQWDVFGTGVYYESARCYA